jgi:CheY-like chemotaxis protein
MTRKFGGSGLGLTISARLAKMMQGSIWVESEPGMGSRFHFTASLGAVNEVEAPPAVHPLAGVPVLVADDNAGSRRILCELLERWGMRPAPAADGEEALSILSAANDRGDPFHMVLADVNLPDMDGFRLAERIQSRPGSRESVVMMLTSARQRRDAGQGRNLAPSAFLIKPVGQSELRQALEEAESGIRRESKRRPARPVPAAPGGSPPPSGARVLLVEDNRVNQQVALVLLQKRGYSVTMARDGEEAVQAAKTGNFDLALMDVQMPNMNGLEATAAIRQYEKRTGGHLPILAMTAHAIKGDEELCLAAGMDGYISKPIRAQELFRAVEKYAPVMQIA